MTDWEAWWAEWKDKRVTVPDDDREAVWTVVRMRLMFNSDLQAHGMNRHPDLETRVYLYRWETYEDQNGKERKRLAASLSVAAAHLEKHAQGVAEDLKGPQASESIAQGVRLVKHD